MERVPRGASGGRLYWAIGASLRPPLVILKSKPSLIDLKKIKFLLILGFG